MCFSEREPQYGTRAIEERTRGMNTASHRRVLVLWVVALAAALALAAGLVLAAAGTAWAKPITFTEVTKFPEETFTDESTRCQTELYATTFSKGMAVEHFTYFPETEVLHFHEWSHGKIVAVPLDGTGPSYRGQFRFGHSDTYSNVERDELVRHTFIDRFVAHGSDGSRAFYKLHAHFTINANGVKTVDFETERLICT